MVSSVPSTRVLTWPVLEAVKGLGGSATIPEITEAVVKSMELSEEQQSIPHGQGRTELEYRLAWARTRLKLLGLLDNSRTGVWSVTDRGQRVATADEVARLFKAYRAAKKAAGAGSGTGDVDADLDNPEFDEDQADDVGNWRDQLLQVLKNMEPDAFERLAQRLMREAGFTNVNVLGKSGDGGIDGVGTYRQSLVSWTVYFQCKRYQSSVGSSAVRDFRGAMSGRGEKGLLITTGTFTASAKDEATRDGAPSVDLVDGLRLCDLLQKYGLGVSSVPRTVYDVTVLPEFFESL
ncbi:restriction endonuclease [Blastococcus sp. HT6-30]|uniref:restriction endonuclease n=1 Tax=Blastococcus sp. HT6-30 TaxID=3144843 RepID=UPI00321907A5